QRCSAGACAASCTSGFADCTTYCADTMNDSQNCGACGTVCPSGQRCAAGGCTASCAPGRTACGAACADTMSDAAHCGGCNNVCPTGEICQAGACLCGFTAIQLGRLQSCGLRSDGKIVCAGSLNTSCVTGQLPDGS